MSDSLLQKSCKLLLESKPIKKTNRKKSEKQRLKKKRNFYQLKQLEEKDFEENIVTNLKKLEKLSKKFTVDVSDKVLPKCVKSREESSEEKEEGSTVFTEKDFEEFEKEYFES